MNDIVIKFNDVFVSVGPQLAEKKYMTLTQRRGRLSEIMLQETERDYNAA